MYVVGQICTPGVCALRNRLSALFQRRTQFSPYLPSSGRSSRHHPHINDTHPIISFHPLIPLSVSPIAYRRTYCKELSSHGAALLYCFTLKIMLSFMLTAFKYAAFFVAIEPFREPTYLVKQAFCCRSNQITIKSNWQTEARSFRLFFL